MGIACIGVTIQCDFMQMLEDEVASLGEKLACITVSESALRTQKSQAEENVEKLRESLESEMQGRVAAESLVAEYEAGIERRCGLALCCTDIVSSQQSSLNCIKGLIAEQNITYHICQILVSLS